MKPLFTKSFLCFLSVFFLFSGCTSQVEKESRVTTLPYYTDATFTPKWLDAIETETIHSIPPFQFTSQNGDTITEHTFDDKIYVADFFFTSCPGICPKMTANMNKVQDAFIDNNDVLLISHSVTPDKDSTSVLKWYAENHNVVNGKWHLVTGNRDEIYQLGRHHYFVEEDLGLSKPNDEFLHTENFILVDKQKHIRGIYNGLNNTSIDQLLKDIALLLKE